jgi:hypothetical protein
VERVVRRGRLAQIAAIGEYQQTFRGVFGRPPNGPDLVRAIASYERTQLSFDSPFDHFVAGDKHAIGDAAQRGWELFNTRGRCNKCHALTEDTRDVTYWVFRTFGEAVVKVLALQTVTGHTSFRGIAPVNALKPRRPVKISSPKMTMTHKIMTRFAGVRGQKTLAASDPGQTPPRRVGTAPSATSTTSNSAAQTCRPACHGSARARSQGTTCAHRR